MNVETLDKAELLMLLSILEGELEAQDVVIHTLRVRYLAFTLAHTLTNEIENYECFKKRFPKLMPFGSDAV